MRNNSSADESTNNESTNRLHGPDTGNGGGHDRLPPDDESEAVLPASPPNMNQDNPNPNTDAPEKPKKPEADAFFDDEDLSIATPSLIEKYAKQKKSATKSEMEKMFGSFERVVTGDSGSMCSVNDEDLEMLIERNRRPDVPHLTPTKETESWNNLKTPSKYVDCSHASFVATPGGTVHVDGCAGNIGDLTGLLETVENYDIGNARRINHNEGMNYLRWVMLGADEAETTTSDASTSTSDASSQNSRKRKMDAPLPYPLESKRSLKNSSEDTEDRAPDSFRPADSDSSSPNSASKSTSLNRVATDDHVNAPPKKEKAGSPFSSSTSEVNSSPSTVDLTHQNTTIDNNTTRAQKRSSTTSLEGGSPAKKPYTSTPIPSKSGRKRPPSLAMSPISPGSPTSRRSFRAPRNSSPSSGLDISSHLNGSSASSSNEDITRSIDNSVQTNGASTSRSLSDSDLRTAREPTPMPLLVLPVLPQQAPVLIPMPVAVPIPMPAPVLPLPVQLPAPPAVAAPTRQQQILKRRIGGSLDAITRCLERISDNGFLRPYVMLDHVLRLQRLQSTLNRLDKELSMTNTNTNSRTKKKDAATIGNDYTKARQRLDDTLAQVKRLMKKD